MAWKHGLEPVSKERRFISVDGERVVAPSSRKNPGFSPSSSSTRLAIRKSASPKKLPLMPVAIWSLIEGSSGLPAHLPEIAAHVVIEERFPVIEASRSRKSMEHGSLIRMPELIHGERILIDHPVLVDDVVPGG